ncbi:MAG: glycosyltransferase family 2 protein [Micavibrio aeruginosavorus]|uniref:Glycosyltransferase family 2 protein n=1 Tax=Micavibrio aeruginosavorus TaxID=349221 RepID=A0A7T5R3B3_9BACT|nr:MAG: glycosyltransferase family 2 protein [Micavibrio aeruginosavorus]
MSKIPVSVLVTTRNEERRIVSCLEALSDFSEIVVIDSASSDHTADLAQGKRARVVPFSWDGAYPKKRQWCLDRLMLAHEWILFIDADEIMTPALVHEIRSVLQAPACNGYFIKGSYVIADKVLRYGLCNNKLILFDRRRFRFPEVDDLDIEGMGEMEGHYQPQAIDGASIGQLRNRLLHHAYDGGEGWESRHRRYAVWEADMNRRNAWPADPVRSRQLLKRIFRAAPGRPLIAFLYGYIWRGGFLDGRAGWRLARDRYRYYALVARSRQYKAGQ